MYPAPPMSRTPPGYTGGDGHGGGMDMGGGGSSMTDGSSGSSGHFRPFLPHSSFLGKGNMLQGKEGTIISSHCSCS